MILPALALGLPRAAVICRLMRGSVLEVFRATVRVRACWPRSLSRRATLFRTMRCAAHALIPGGDRIGLQIGYLVARGRGGGELFVTGRRRLRAQRGSARDYPSVQGFHPEVVEPSSGVNLIVDLSTSGSTRASHRRQGSAGRRPERSAPRRATRR